MTRGTHRHTAGARGVNRPTRTYNSWMAMRARCENKKNKAYPDYGGRGITVCPEWESFEAFLADMGEAPEGMTLDRRKNHEGYSKANCRWATRTEQNRNTRKNRMLTYNGKTLCLSEWATIVGIDIVTLHCRLRDGWSDERALSTPVARGRNRTTNVNLTFQGDTLNLAEWGRRFGINGSCIRTRIDAGWSIERAITTPSRRSSKTLSQEKHQ